MVALIKLFPDNYNNKMENGYMKANGAGMAVVDGERCFLDSLLLRHLPVIGQIKMAIAKPVGKGQVSVY